MKILLLTPIISRRELWGQYEKGGGAYFPIGLLSIAAVVRKARYDVELIDASTLKWDEITLENHLKVNRYDVIGLGNCYTALAHTVFKTARLCRRTLPDAKIVVGGIHPTLFPKKTLQECEVLDISVMGEGEESFLELLNFFESKKENPQDIAGIAYRTTKGSVVVNIPRTSFVDLSELPTFPYSLIDVDRYIPPPSNYKRLPTFGFMVQRGCPYRCAYCDSRIHGKHVRHRNIDTVISEMKYLVEEHGMKGVLFHDSCLTINREFSMELFQRMIDEKLDISWTAYTRVDKVDPELLS